jgi:hypothetical protein
VPSDTVGWTSISCSEMSATFVPMIIQQVFMVHEYPVISPLPRIRRENVVFACLLTARQGLRFSMTSTILCTIRWRMRTVERYMVMGLMLALDWSMWGGQQETALCGMVVSSSGQRVARLYWYEKVRADHGDTMAQHLASNFQYVRLSP